jgi:hypothetical protein
VIKPPVEPIEEIDTFLIVLFRSVVDTVGESLLGTRHERQRHLKMTVENPFANGIRCSPEANNYADSAREILGFTYKWDFRTGTIVAVIVRYTRKSEPLCWLVAASGIWMSDGYHFRSGKALKDRSELFI